MKKLFIFILILAFVSLILYIYSEEIITKIKLFLDNLKGIVLDFFSKIWEEIKKEFDKRIKIIKQEIEKIILQIKKFLIEQFEKGIQNIFQNISEKFKEIMSR